MTAPIFTREQLEDFQAVAYNHPLDGYRNTVQDLAAFALALLDRAEKAEELTEDKDRTLAQAIKSHLREVDKRKQAETISAGNLARAEKAEAERDEANDERDDAVARWSRRAREAEAACKELLQVQAERDRLREELLGAKVAWDMCDAVNGRLREGLREATALLSDAATEMEASGGWDGDEDLFDRIMTYLRTRERKEKEE